MTKFLSIVLALSMISGCPTAHANTSASPATTPSAKMMETIVCIRHGEKPPHGLGQLTCRGLNRSLALPNVLISRYGTPNFIFAPNPTEMVDGKDNTYYYYVRPLATIEPTAIRCGLPVNTAFGYRDIDRLETELQEPKYQNATIFIAWEHGLLDEFARNMVKDHGGKAKSVPAWKGEDYDTIFVFQIISDHGHKSFSFSIDHEGLNGLSDAYPQLLKK